MFYNKFKPIEAAGIHEAISGNDACLMLENVAKYTRSDILIVHILILDQIYVILKKTFVF